MVAGGSLRDWIAALERVLELDFDLVIPGHGGGVSDREGVKAFQRLLRELWAQVDAAVRAGKSLEETLAAAVHRPDPGAFLSLEPGTAQKMLQVLGRAAEDVSLQNLTPLVLTNPGIRLPLRKLLEKVLPGLVVMSHNEADGPIRTLQVVSLEG